MGQFELAREVVYGVGPPRHSAQANACGLGNAAARVYAGCLPGARQALGALPGTAWPCSGSTGHALRHFVVPRQQDRVNLLAQKGGADPQRGPARQPEQPASPGAASTAPAEPQPLNSLPCPPLFFVASPFSATARRRFREIASLSILPGVTSLMSCIVATPRR